MGFPIDLPLGKGMTINYLLCIIALSCFFLAQVLHGDSANGFLPFRKKYDRKKQQQGGCAEATKKTVQAMRYEW